MSSRCLNDVRGRVGMPLCMCVHVRRCACVQKPPPPHPPVLVPSSVRQACSLCLYRRSVYSSAGLPPHLNGLDSQPRKKHSGTTGEDVLLNRGIGLGKSAGRPFLPSIRFISADTQERRHFYSAGPDQQKERTSTPAHKEPQQSFFRMGVSPYVIDDNQRAWI